MKITRLDLDKELLEPWVVETSPSLKITTSRGKDILQPIVSKEPNQDKELTKRNLTLMSASPELYESNVLLLEALKRALAGEVSKNIDECISFAEKALIKATGSNDEI